MDLEWYGRLGRRIARFRAQLGVTQEELAERAGIGASYVARIEAGTRRPTLDVLGALAGALKVSLARLITDDTEVRAADSGVPRPLRALLDVAGDLDAADLQTLMKLAVRLRED